MPILQMRRLLEGTLGREVIASTAKPSPSRSLQVGTFDEASFTGILRPREGPESSGSQRGPSFSCLCQVGAAPSLGHRAMRGQEVIQKTTLLPLGVSRL